MSGVRAPGRRSPARAGSRAQSVTSLPARLAWTASAVPQAPAPTTAMLLFGEGGDMRALPCPGSAELVVERLQDRSGGGFEALARVAHEQAAAVQAGRVGGGAPPPFG